MTIMHLPFVIFKVKSAEQVLGGIPLGLGVVVEDRPSELLCTYTCMFAGSMRESVREPQRLVS